jgi:hypothetical protein
MTNYSSKTFDELRRIDQANGNHLEVLNYCNRNAPKFYRSPSGVWAEYPDVAIRTDELVRMATEGVPTAKLVVESRKEALNMLDKL